MEDIKSDTETEEVSPTIKNHINHESNKKSLTHSDPKKKEEDTPAFSHVPSRNKYTGMLTEINSNHITVNDYVNSEIRQINDSYKNF